MNEQQSRKMKDYVWIIIMSFAAFVLIGAVWIRKTYGTLTYAMTNEFFVNYLRNKRSLFFKYVIIPTVCIFLFLLIVQEIMRKKEFRFRNGALMSVSFVLMILSFGGAALCLDAGTYFERQYRLSKEQWYDEDRIVVHALGRIDGVTYTNSKEALENSYQNGVRSLECDFSMTADNQIVACHDWDFWYGWEHDTQNATGGGYTPDFDEFMNTKVRKRFTALSGEELILFMKDHPDVYIITDTKDGEPDTLAEPFKALVKLAKDNGCEEVLDRFVVQIYHMYMYEMVDEIYPFPNYILTLYGEGYNGEEDRMEEYAQFCMLRDIDVITMWSDLYHDELLDIANRYGLKIFVHTVNDEDKVKGFLEKGVGVYTDETNFSFR